MSPDSEPEGTQSPNAMGSVSADGDPANVSSIRVGVCDSHPLSVREFEVLHWLSEGKSGIQVSKILGISLGTVRVHIRNINLKLSASNIPHAVAQGFKRGILGR